VVAAVVVAAVAFLLLGSAGGGLDGPIAQAAVRSASAPGYRVHMAVQISSSAMSRAVSGSLDGIVDLRDRASSMTLAMDVGGDPGAAAASGGHTMRMEMIVDGAVVYARLPAGLTAALPGADKPWIKVDVTRLAALPGLSSLGAGPASGDPGQMLQFLRSVSGDIVTVGPEVVDGVETTHYQGEIGLDTLTGALPGGEQGLARQALSALSQATAGQSMPVDVWVDRQGLIRRFAMTVDLTFPGGQSLHETATADFTDYGPQQPPAAPPAGQVQDLSRLAGTAGD
jgi:hypothetical protein